MQELLIAIYLWKNDEGSSIKLARCIHPSGAARALKRQVARASLPLPAGSLLIGSKDFEPFPLCWSRASNYIRMSRNSDYLQQQQTKRHDVHSIKSLRVLFVRRINMFVDELAASVDCFEPHSIDTFDQINAHAVIRKAKSL